jgi:outer membrane receptor for Fe3+-dicitrate
MKACHAQAHGRHYIFAEIVNEHGLFGHRIHFPQRMVINHWRRFAPSHPAGIDPLRKVKHKRKGGLEMSHVNPPPFSDHRWDVESSAFAEDQVRTGNWNVSAGLRLDQYKFAVNETAWSPRLGVSRFIPSLNLLVHASYDRVFQTPALENLLVASSPKADTFSSAVLQLPVQPARANYYEVGFTKSFAGKVRVDGNVFRRDFQNFSDDNVLFNTGFGFPIAFANAHISGEEIQVSVPRWGRFSGFLSYSNQTGTGQGPFTGGLFLGAQISGVSDTSKFPISQDQRNTARARVRYQAASRLWFAAAAEFGSGLPVSLDNPINYSDALAQYGAAILNQVNFGAGRVRQNFSLDVSAGGTLYHKEAKEISGQLEINNLGNRLNVLNFASLFSGTAIAAPRSIGGHLKFTF